MPSTIVLLPGDGIGPEVVSAAVTVLHAVAERFGHQFDFISKPIGASALDGGLDPLPADTLDACQRAEAVFLGAVGDPRYDAVPRNRKPETGLLQLRKALGVYANLRPARAWRGLESGGPLRPERLAGTDLFIIRELTGGLYFGEPRGFTPDGSAAFNTLRYSRTEIERIAEVAFRTAAGRRRKVTSVDKANVLETSQLWRSVVTEVGQRYPDVQLNHQYVDSCAMSLVIEPSRFDVIVTENLFGDILSDEAGAIAGSLGLLPSASIGDGPGLYEPVHGLAPTLAGRDVANPIGAIGSAAMMLRYSLKAEEAAAAVERAIDQALDSGYRTADIMSPGTSTSVGCSVMAKAIADRVLAEPVPA